MLSTVSDNDGYAVHNKEAHHRGHKNMGLFISRCFISDNQERWAGKFCVKTLKYEYKKNSRGI